MGWRHHDDVCHVSCRFSWGSQNKSLSTERTGTGTVLRFSLEWTLKKNIMGTNKKKHRSQDETKSLSSNSAIEAILGPTLLINQQASRPTSALLKGKDLIGIYFAASWYVFDYSFRLGDNNSWTIILTPTLWLVHRSKPCQDFTPILCDFYKDLQQQSTTSKAAEGRNAGSLEIVFCSSDEDRESFSTFFETMPWLAMDAKTRSCTQQKKALVDMLKAFRIPKLVVLDAATGNFVTDTALNQVVNQYRDTEKTTKKKAAEQLVATWKEQPSVPLGQAWAIGQGGMLGLIEFFLKKPLYMVALFGVLVATPVVSMLLDKPMYAVMVFFLFTRITADKGDRTMPYVEY